MELNTPKPETLTDSSLLRFVVRLFEIEHLRENVDGKKSFADMLGCTVQHIENCLAGRSHLGIEEWSKIIAQSGSIARAMFKKYLATCEYRANHKPKREVEKM